MGGSMRGLPAEPSNASNVQELHAYSAYQSPFGDSQMEGHATLVRPLPSVYCTQLLVLHSITVGSASLVFRNCEMYTCPCAAYSISWLERESPS
jgi:hypothetical protein